MPNMEISMTMPINSNQVVTPLNGSSPAIPSKISEPQVTSNVTQDSFATTLNKLTATEPAPPATRNTKTTELYDWLIEEGTLDPEWAETSAYLYGCEYIDSPLIYIGDWPIIRIAATGEILTPEKEAYFKKVSDLYHGGRVDLYESELAKGTPALEIIKKIFDYNDTLPEGYRKMRGWS
jgi:hypothetical protein